MTIALNHSFITNIAHGSAPQLFATLTLIQHCIRRTRTHLHVHEGLWGFDCGNGPFLEWAHTMRRDPDRAPLVELITRMVSGPFLPEADFEGVVNPPIDTLDEWLQAVVRRLLAINPASEALRGMVSPAPNGGADDLYYTSSTTTISNWLDITAFDNELALQNPERTTLQVLQDAEQQMDGQLVVLPSAVRSADAWTLDCSASALHQALLGLEYFAQSLQDGCSREEAAKRYHSRTTTPMSQESADTWRRPARRRQRMFVADSHGEQYFDMHAKPGNMTRVHIWVATQSTAAPTIYVGHCGRHLD